MVMKRTVPAGLCLPVLQVLSPGGCGKGQAKPCRCWEELTLSKLLLCAQPNAWHNTSLRQHSCKVLVTSFHR